MSGEQFEDLFALPPVVPPRSTPRPISRPRCTLIPRTRPRDTRIPTPINIDEFEKGNVEKQITSKIVLGMTDLIASDIKKL